MTLTEGSLAFSFCASCTAVQYESWAFYRRQLLRIQGTKAVDFLCVSRTCTWLIEVKDYRFHPRTKPSSLCDEVASKARDTLAGLAAARTYESVLSRTDVQDKLRRILKAIDAHPKVVDRNSLHPGLCWTVASLPVRLGP